jgi:hypothetical protein
MTKERDIELAREVGFNTEHAATNEYLHQFAQRVRAEEREICAKRLEAVGCDHCAANIRKRGQE